MSDPHLDPRVQAVLDAIGRYDPEQTHRDLDAVVNAEHTATPDPEPADLPPSPLLAVLQDIASALNLMAHSIEEINFRDALWRRS